MTSSASLTALRKRHYALEGLPDTIFIPARGTIQQVAKPLMEASLDEVAFALRGLDAEFSALADRAQALRKLDQFARDAGALGADNAVAAAMAAKRGD